MLRSPRWVLAVLLLLVAAPAAQAAGDATVFAPDCSDPSQRSTHYCLNPSSVGDATLTADSTTVTAGQRITLSVSAPSSCPQIGTVGQPPCAKVTWVPLYGASLANWGVNARANVDLTDVVGCRGDDHSCAFTVEQVPDGDPAKLPDGTALRVTAIVEIDGYGCGVNFCSYGPMAAPHGGGWLDWKLRYQPACGASASRATASAAAAGACPDGIGWDMEDRTSEVPHIAAGSPVGMLRQKDVYAPLTVGLHLMRGGKPASGTCTRSSQWTWDVLKKPAGAKILSKPFNGSCSSMQVSANGAYTVRARRYDDGKLSQTLRKKIPVQDLLVVAMGDSNGSGEGAGPFWHEQCNRGSASYQYQAAHLLEQVTGLKASATFVSASCSGAVVSDLVDTRYEGIHPGPPLSPQIRQLAQRLDPPRGKERRKVDAAIVSIGVNDLGFGPILAYCIAYEIKKVAGPACEDSPVKVRRSDKGSVAEYVKDPGGKTTLGETIDGLVRKLPDRYRELARELSRTKLVKPGRVFLSQYPFFFYDTGGTLCTSQGGVLGGTLTTILPSTWQWLSFEGNKLNRAVRAAAGAHGWNAIEVPRQLFFGHGYCAADSWFVSLQNAVTVNANKAGAFHPTERGAHVTGVFVLRRLCGLLDDRRTCGTLPAP